MIDLDDAGTLLHGRSREETCEMLGITMRTLLRWRNGTTPMPKAIKMLLQFVNYGQLEPIGGKEWEGFSINMKDKRLNIPNFSPNREGFSPAEFKMLFWRITYLPKLERENAEYKTELLAKQTELDAEIKKSEYYREQLRQAGREYITQHAISDATRGEPQ